MSSGNTFIYEKGDRKTQNINSCTLKSIAVITMLIDHLGAALFPQYMIMRYIGRLAFPIYCFLLVEGYFHTHDIRKYMLRLLAFGIVSELPFDMAVYGSIWSLKHQNVYFTLLIGLAVVALLEYISVYMEEKRIILGPLMIIAGCLLAELMNTDYGMGGIMLILVFYFTRNKDNLTRCVLGECVMAGMGAVEALGGLSLIFICMYNGEKGYRSKAVQYFFYIFYPLHLLVIGILRLYVM